MQYRHFSRVGGYRQIGEAGENAKVLVGGGSHASGRQLSDYEGLNAARVVQTPRTTPQRKYLWKQNARFGIYLFIFNRRQLDDRSEKAAYKYMNFLTLGYGRGTNGQVERVCPS